MKISIDGSSTISDMSWFMAESGCYVAELNSDVPFGDELKISINA